MNYKLNKESNYLLGEFMKKLLLIPSMFLLSLVSSCCGSCDNSCDNNNGCVRSCEKKSCEKKSSCERSQDSSSDWTVTTKVKAAILADTSISAFARFVSVNTTDGVVTLTGKVPTRDDAHKIVRIVKGVKGVRRVDNQMTISN